MLEKLIKLAGEGGVADNFTEGDEFPEENAAVLERLEKKRSEIFYLSQKIAGVEAIPDKAAGRVEEPGVESPVEAVRDKPTGGVEAILDKPTEGVEAVRDKKAGGVLQKLRNSCHKEPKAESPVEAEKPAEAEKPTRGGRRKAPEPKEEAIEPGGLPEVCRKSAGGLPEVCRSSAGSVPSSRSTLAEGGGCNVNLKRSDQGTPLEN